MLRPLLLVLLLSCAAWAAADNVKPSDKLPLAGDDAETLRRSGVKEDAAPVLAILRGATVQGGEDAEIQRLVRQLGNDNCGLRERASFDLVQRGAIALPRLRLALDDADPEIRRRARDCVEELETRLSGDVTRAAFRWIVRSKPRGAVEALLACLPTTGPLGEEEVLRGLADVALRDGKADPALKAVLSDPKPQRRAAAALTLGRLGGEGNAARVALADRDATVRLRAAQGLLAGRDDAALPALIALLETPSVDVAWQAEELLHWAACGAAPEPVLGAPTPQSRKTCRAAWEAWWKAQAHGLNWKALDADHRRPGLLLIVEWPRIWLTGCDGKVRWESAEDQAELMDAWLLPGGRLLVLDTRATSRLREMDLSGKVVWEKVFPFNDSAQACQPLPNGNVFVVCDERVFELDRAGKELVSRSTGSSVFDAVRLADGRILWTEERGLALLDSSGATTGVMAKLKDVQLPNRPLRLTSLPGDGAAVALMDDGQIFRLSAQGEATPTARLPGVQSIAGLGDGGLLAAQADPEGEANRIVEIDPTGRTVWDLPTISMPMRVRPCLNLLRIGLERPRAEGFTVDSVAHRMTNLTNLDPIVRERGALLLGRFNVEAKPALAALLKALEDSDRAVGQNAATALARIGPDAIQPLIGALQKGRPAARLGAARALGRMGETVREASAPLTATLKNRKGGEDLRQAAADALGAIGPNAGAEAVAALLATLHDEEAGVRKSVAAALSLVGPSDSRTVPALIEAMKDPKLDVQTAVVQALGRLKAAAAPAAPALLAMLKRLAAAKADPNRSNFLLPAVVNTLGAIGSAAKEAAPVLAALVKDASQPFQARRNAVQTIGRIGPEAREALPILLEVLQETENNSMLAQALTQTMGLMGRDGVLTLGEAIVGGSGRNTKRYAIQALQRLGEKAEPARAYLTEAATDPDSYIASMARRMLDRLPKKTTK